MAGKIKVPEGFLELPILILHDQYGVDIRIINMLEKQGRITIDDLQGVTPEQLFAVKNISTKYVDTLRTALRMLLRDMRMEEKKNGD